MPYQPYTVPMACKSRDSLKSTVSHQSQKASFWCRLQASQTMRHQPTHWIPTRIPSVSILLSLLPNFHLPSSHENETKQPHHLIHCMGRARHLHCLIFPGTLSRVRNPSHTTRRVMEKWDHLMMAQLKRSMACRWYAVYAFTLRFCDFIIILLHIYLTLVILKGL